MLVPSDPRAPAKWTPATHSSSATDRVQRGSVEAVVSVNTLCVRTCTLLGESAAFI